MEVLVGDAVEALRQVPDNSVRACITSPPYWWQRDYAVEGQYGLEPTPSEFVGRIVRVFAEVRRVLVADGTAWLNLGDSWNNRTVARPSSHQGGFGHSNESIRRSWRDHAANGTARLSVREGGLKEKDLVGIPWRTAFALQEAGWWLRSEVIWHKPYGKPEPVKDRPSYGHETVFLFAKSKRYYYARHELAARTVWTIPPSVHADDDHSAAFPEDLVLRCLFVSTEPGDVVLDPFAGSCTVGVASRRHGRDFVGVELDAEVAGRGRARVLSTEALPRWAVA